MRAKMGAAAIAATAIALTGCSSSKSSSKNKDSGNKTQASAVTNDINATPYDQVPDGGTMRWALDSFPPNFNVDQVDGNENGINQLMKATLPAVFHYDAGSKPTLNTVIVDKAEITSPSPQAVAYHINPKAVWSDGTPITYKDFEGMWKADNGTNKAYKPASTNGYEQITSVEKGATDQDVKVTFKTTYPDWQSLFDPLTPASLNATPESFNKSWADSPKLAGGPFMVDKIDKTAKTITLVRNDKWTGPKAKLDKIQFIVLDPEAQAKALQSDQIDFVDIGSSVATYALVKKTPGVVIHKAGGPNWRHIDLGKAGPLADLKVRQAVVLSIDREGDAKTLLSPLDWPAAVLESHIWMNNQSQYKSTCGDFCKRDVAKAATLLEEAGYQKGSDGFYAKDGKTLDLQFVIAAGVKTQADESALQQKALKEAGIKVTLKTVPADPYFPEYVRVGKFDLAIFSWIGTPYPISSSKSIYTSDGDQNYAKIGTPDIDALFQKAVTELDPQKAADLTYQIDQQIWTEGHSVPLYQRPELIGAKSTLLNYGAFGFADTVYENIGFKK
jgi:peptide/nickel transport system substrate-binding protein